MNNGLTEGNVRVLSLGLPSRAVAKFLCITVPEEQYDDYRQQILNNQAIVEALQKYYDQSDFEDADTAIDYLHIVPKLKEILNTTYHSIGSGDEKNV